MCSVLDLQFSHGGNERTKALCQRTTEHTAHAAENRCGQASGNMARRL